MFWTASSVRLRLYLTQTVQRKENLHIWLHSYYCNSMVIHVDTDRNKILNDIFRVQCDAFRQHQLNQNTMMTYLSKFMF